MENYNDLVLSYYAAVDSGNATLTNRLLGEILTVVKNDRRVLACLMKNRVSDIEEALSDISFIILKAIRRPEVRWNPLKGASFMTWVGAILRKMIATIYRSKGKEKKLKSLNRLNYDPSTDQALSCGKKLNLWHEMVSPKAWERLSPDQKQIINMKREGIKGEKIAEDLGWHPSKVTKEKKKAIKLIKASSDELGSFNRGNFYEIMFVDVSVMVRNN